MKRFLLACGLCSAMLATAVFLFMPSSLAKALFSPAVPQKENVLEALLDLPAPPPMNPLETTRARDDAFYDPRTPPPDNAPIEDLIDYWSHQSNNYRGVLYYLPRPSETVIQRLLTEGGNAVIADVVMILPDDKRTSEIVKQIFDDPSTDKDEKSRLKNWLTLNSSYFADETERSAASLKDVDHYVSVPRQDALLSLTRHDWDRAKPIVDRLYADSSQPVSRALATWALYRHAMESGGLGDTDRYRSELMRMVENRNLSDGARDMANDAIVREPDFPGRDDWCWSLFQDETLVNMERFTGLTTLIMYAPPDKYVAKMTEFLNSDSKTVRKAAARNLITAMEREKSPEIVRALLPWIGDAKWIDRPPDDPNRTSLVMSLQNIKMPESVPALIAALDETATRQIEDYGSYGNSNSTNSNRASMAMAAAANAMAAAANTLSGSVRANSANAVPRKMKEETYFPLRDYAVRALAKQADPRAVAALKRVLNSTPSGYQRTELVAAIMVCGGYSVSEQVEALEKYARSSGEILSTVDAEGGIATTNSNVGYYNRGYYETMARIAQGDDIEEALGMMVASSREPTDELVRATVALIEKLEPKDQITARALRKIITSWKGLAVSAILLSDLKTGKAESAAVVRLLTERRSIKEKLAAEIDNAAKGTPIAAGIAACLSDEPTSYASALDSKSSETRTAVLACARLIRSELPLAKVAENLSLPDVVLKTAAELYLESEDSPAARSLVYAQHTGEAKVLGATSFFKGRKESAVPSVDIAFLFASVNSTANWLPYMYGPGDPRTLDKTEERLQKEVKDDKDLSGIYAYQDNFIRIYKDKVVYSWEDDPSRYHERNLSTGEFDQFKQYLSAHHVSEMKPFLSCAAGCGTARELLMVGKNGGSRVYLRSDRTPEFFIGLEKIFSNFRLEPSAIKYTLSKDVPGLELLFASDEFDAEAVWKQGSDLRVVVSNKEIREKVEDEIGQMEEEESNDDGDSDEAPEMDATDARPAPEMMSPSEKMRAKREYEGYAWHRVANGQLGEIVDQPTGAEYIPLRDQFDVQPDEEEWKTRAAGFEIRADITGLYKVAGGKMTRLRTGNYGDPVISPNGRWVIVRKTTDDEGESLVRYNLITNREYPVAFNGEGNLYPRCYVPALGKFLLAAGYYEEGYYDRDDDENDGSPSARRFYSMDPETGVLLPVSGDARPLSDQTFRSLQPTGKGNQFWAAMPSKARGETVVGVFDSRIFRFQPVLKLPKINFDSMDMWVDESENKVYFVYSGHLLRVPLKMPQLR